MAKSLTELVTSHGDIVELCLFFVDDAGLNRDGLGSVEVVTGHHLYDNDLLLA